MKLPLESYNHYMSEALTLARKAGDAGEVPIGAVIVHQEKIIATAHNEVEKLNDPTAHAEKLAIQRAAKALKNWRLTECALFVTLEPCTMCFGALSLSRIPLLVFGAFDPTMGAVGSIYDLSIHNPTLRVVSRTHEEESKILLKNFFTDRRKN